MLLVCTSCNSRYLVNSADLKPNGRIVRCASCSHEWVQKPNLIVENNLETSVSRNFKKENNESIQDKNSVSNLPSTYIIKDKPKIFNSILLVLLIIILVLAYWFINNYENGLLFLLNGMIALFDFYIQEFYFNLKLIINDLVKLAHQIIN